MKILVKPCDVLQQEISEAFQYLGEEIVLWQNESIHDIFHMHNPDILLIDEKTYKKIKKVMPNLSVPTILYMDDDQNTLDDSNVVFCISESQKQFGNILKYQRCAPNFRYESHVLIILSNPANRGIVDEFDDEPLKIKCISDQDIASPYFVGFVSPQELLELSVSAQIVLTDSPNLQAALLLRNCPTFLIDEYNTEQIVELTMCKELLEQRFLLHREQVKDKTIFDLIGDIGKSLDNDWQKTALQAKGQLL